MTRTISLKGEFIRKEAEASGAIKPGSLIEFGGSKDVQVHGTAGGVARKAFALENDLIGRGIDDAYALGETVQYAVCPHGAEIYALLNYGENVAKGVALVSAGDGSLMAAATEPQQDSIVAWALEAVNNTAGGVDARIRVEVA